MITADMKKYMAPQIFDSEGIPPVIILKGSNYEMGYQYGKKFAAKIYTLITKERASILAVFPIEQIKMNLRLEQHYVDEYDPAFRQWQEGISAACKEEGYDITVEDILFIAMFTSLFYTCPQGAYPEGFGPDAEPVKKESEVPERHFCNSFIARGEATEDGKTMIVGNGGSAYEAIDRQIVICYPDEGPAYTFFGTVGKFQDQMGLNMDGFGWVFTGNYSKADCDWGAMPEFTMHYLSQCVKTTEQGQEYIKNMPRCGCFGNFLMADDKGNASCTETNSEIFHVRNFGDLDEEGEYIVNTNHFASKEYIDQNVELDGMDWTVWNHQSIKRFATLNEYVKEGAAKGEINEEFVRRIFASDDWYDPETKEWHINDQGADMGWSNGFDGFDYTELTIIKPEERKIYYMQGTGSGTGMPAGSYGQFVEFTLADDPFALAKAMQENTFNVIYVNARNKLRTVINDSVDLQKDFASRRAFEDMLDLAYLEYERGMDRISFAFMNKYNGLGDEVDYLDLLAESMSYFAKTQTYCKKISTDLDYYTK